VAHALSFSALAEKLLLLLAQQLPLFFLLLDHEIRAAGSLHGWLAQSGWMQQMAVPLRETHRHARSLLKCPGHAPHQHAESDQFNQWKLSFLTKCKNEFRL